MMKTVRTAVLLLVSLGVLLWVTTASAQAVSLHHVNATVFAGDNGHCTDGHGNDGNKNPHCQYPPKDHCTDGHGNDGDKNPHCNGEKSSYTLATPDSTDGGLTVGMAFGGAAVLFAGGLLLMHRRRANALNS
jgi:hypothetical protein